MRSRVAVLRTRPETVLEDITRLCELAGVRTALREGTRTILKDNISWHFPFPGANTTPWQLEGTILALRQAGFADLVCVQNDTVVTDPRKGERLNGYMGVLSKHNVPTRYNCFDWDLKWVPYQPKGEMLALPKIFPHGIHVPEFFFGTNIVHLPTVKCHIYTTTTGAMKNAFGGLLATRRHYTHTWIHETLVDLLTIQREIHTGLFAVMDGTTVGNGPGPRTMVPVRKDVMLASADQVAIDAVAARLMGFDPLGIRYLALAGQRGLGVADTRDIELVGESEIGQENWHFSVGDNLASRVGDLLWFGPLKRLQKLFFRTPLVYLFVAGSYVYHDYVWYPAFGRRQVRGFVRTSPWGVLFERYLREQANSGTRPALGGAGAV
ncbi:MAG TPA: DUF362 domain-containing protein [Thermoanaerobaculaceae bacterium]|nr:DUF362 domain-containing protein [Thermoanaerobaculaceae bacterium]